MNDQAGVRYEFRVKGVLERRWSAWFDGLQVTSDDHGQAHGCEHGRASRKPVAASSHKERRR
jgi:hypothetical protein